MSLVPNQSLFPSAGLFPSGATTHPSRQAELPHFDTTSGFRLGPDGQPVVCEQDSAKDIDSGARNVLACPQGAAVFDDTFGIPFPLFEDQPLDLEPIIDAVRAQDDRVDVDATQIPDLGDIATQARMPTGKSIVTVDVDSDTDTTPDS